MARSPLTVVNPSDRHNHQSRWSKPTPRWVLSFGSSPIYLMVWGHLEDALEEAGDWLAENAPGLIMTHDSEELRELYREAAKELGAPDDDPGSDMGDSYGVHERATADLTYTEAGYLTSHEWGIALGDEASRADVKAFIARLAARHYGDGPVCDITR